MNIDDFDLPEINEEELEQKRNEFIDNQEVPETINDCESGACAI